MIKSEHGKMGILWNAIGTVAASMVSILLLMVASRLTDPSTADIFSFSFTVAQQLYVVGLFGVRQYQSTDVLEKYNFSEYFVSRIVTVILMLVFLSLYLYFNDVNREFILPIILLTCYRGFDAFSDVFQGFFQQHGRSDLAGKLLFVHSFISIISFTASIIVLQSLVLSVLAILIANFIIFVVQDVYYFIKYVSLTSLSNIPSIIRNSKVVTSILLNCSSIFINTFLVNYIYSEPKFALTSILQNNGNFEGVQRDFNIIFMPSFVLTLLVYILRPLLTELSLFWHQNEVLKYKKQIKKIIVHLIFFQIMLLLSGFLFGIPVLNAVFGLELTQYKLSFMVLLVGGGLNLYSVLLDNLMTIHRKQSYLLIVTVLTFITSKVITPPFITHYGVTGAAISFLISMFVYFSLSFVIYIYINKNIRKNK